MHRLRQTVSRCRRHGSQRCALLLFTLKKGSKLDQLLAKLNPLTRFEDTIEVLPDDRIGIILEGRQPPQGSCRQTGAGSGDRRSGRLFRDR